MTSNHFNIQHNFNSQSVATKARLLMERKHHQVKNRAQSMVNRVAQEVGIDI